jgi:predicted alpha/beta-fold hydrolase
MAVIYSNDFKPSLGLINPHVQTIYPSLFRNVEGVTYSRERIETPDSDFLDLDWSVKGNDKLAVVLHGLEGSSDRPYIKGMVLALNQGGFDAVSMNMRGCSGENNRFLYAYHSGKTEDLETVIQHIQNKYSYSEISLIGFSLGGNLIIKYVGEKGNNIASQITKMVAVSAPNNLQACSEKLTQLTNFPYNWKFVNDLIRKSIEKGYEGPKTGRVIRKDQVKTVIDFDFWFTAPVHGFESAWEYYRLNSGEHFIENVKVKSLLITAQNDPFLTEVCFPIKQTKSHKYVDLEITRHGGHVGFMPSLLSLTFWHESRVMKFLLEGV